MESPALHVPIPSCNVFNLYSTGRGLIHWEGYCDLFPDDSRSPHICLHANARLWLPAFYSASKTLKQKPHTHVFPSHMVVIVYVHVEHTMQSVCTLMAFSNLHPWVSYILLHEIDRFSYPEMAAEPWNMPEVNNRHLQEALDAWGINGHGF